MPNTKLYTIIEEDSVGATLAGAAAQFQYELLERVFDALIWRLAREPECGTPFTHPSGTDYRLVRTLPLASAKNPTILARYIVDHASESVTIDWIKVYPFDAKEALSLDEYEI